MEKIKIPKLKKGDSVAIISTARKVQLKDIEFAVNTLKSWGLVVCFGKNLFKEYHQFAGTIQQRTNDLHWAINTENIKAILFARGGYGSIQIVDNVDWTPFAKKPKWFF